MDIDDTGGTTSRRRAGSAARVSAAIAACSLALPAGTAPALSTSVSSVAAPNAATAEGHASVTWPAGQLLSGGGARVDQSVLSNGTAPRRVVSQAGWHPIGG